MSLRYRITLTIFLLELVMVVFVLGQSLVLFRDHSRQMLESTELATIGLLGSLAREALLTEEYESFRPHIDDALRSDYIEQVVLVDARGRVLAASNPGEVDRPEAAATSDEGVHWRTLDIRNETGLIGTLSVKFSHQALAIAFQRARNYGLVFAAAGMLIIAAVGLVMGYVLTARLSRLVDVAARLGRGDYTSRAHLTGRDEVAVLGTVMDQMADQVEADRAVMAQHNRELAERVAARTADLTKLLQEMESFSYSVSHDLRSPLRAVNGYCAILEEDYESTLDPQARDYLRRIREATTRMGELIDDLLVLARISKAVPQRRDVDLSAVCNEIIQELRSSQVERSVDVSIEEHMHVFADPHLVRPLIKNLLQNAWKYSRDSDPAIIKVGSVKREDTMVYYVQDNGIGFEMKQAGRLFEPFQRLYNLSQYEGTGIGLAIVQRIIDRHGGKVWAESDPGKGATFFFTLSPA